MLSFRILKAMKTIKHFNFLLIFILVVIIFSDIIYLLKSQLQKKPMRNSDHSELVRFCLENNVEIAIAVVLLLCGISLYQILKK